MLLIIINVIFVLSAVAMTVLILLQQGSGAAAGSGFGGGASATVFGARGSANFLSKATKWLAVVFFAISLGLAWYASKGGNMAKHANDLGIMGAAPSAIASPATPGNSTTPALPTPTAPAATTPTPPAATAPAVPPPAASNNAAPSTAPAVPAPQPVASPAKGGK